MLDLGVYWSAVAFLVFHFNAEGSCETPLGVDASGAKGVAVCFNKAQLNQAFAYYFLGAAACGAFRPRLMCGSMDRVAFDMEGLSKPKQAFSEFF